MRAHLPLSTLAIRLLTAIVGVPVFLGIAVAGGPLYGLAMVLTALVACWEIRSMLQASGFRSNDAVLFGLAAFLPFFAWYGVQRTDGLPLFAGNSMVLLGVAILASLLIQMRRPRDANMMADWALSLAGALYIGGLLQFYAPLRDRPEGHYWATFTIGLTWIADTAAYTCGRLWGRTPLAPAISPRKSVEGAVGALVATALFAVPVGALFGQAPLRMLWFGFVIAAAAVFGDLAESMLKRQMGAKDSGGAVPGHGGILDRMDSMLFAAPVAVLFLATVP